MPAPLPKSLQSLLDIGIVHVKNPNHVNAVPARPAASPIAVAGSLLGSDNPPVSSDTRAAPAEQPPLFWKAIGFCLKDNFTSSGSLYDDDSAVFFGDPGQAGIVEGGAWPAQVTNYQVFLYGDTMQRVDFPTFTLTGNSYFEFVNLYLKNVLEGTKSSEFLKARQALVDAKNAKDRAWENCRAAFSKQLLRGGPNKQDSLIKYIHGDEAYQAAWDAESNAEQAFTKLRSPAWGSASTMLNMVRLADSRLKPQVGNNMPVVAVDQDWLQAALQDPTKNPQDLVDPSMVYYRPLYSLPQYATTADYWTETVGASSRMVHDGPYMIPLAGVWDREWSELGHPLLDHAKPHESLSDDQKNFINSISATLTFLQKPYAGNIDRGLWDVTDLRGKFNLHPDAPPSIKSRGCKTSKLILAWGIEIVFTIPDIISLDAVKNVTLAAMDLPLKSVGKKGNKLVFSAGGDGFPVLVGAFANII